MKNQNLFTTLQSLCGFTAQESDIKEILDTVEKDKAEVATTNVKIISVTAAPFCEHKSLQLDTADQTVSCAKCGIRFRGIN